MSDVTSVEHDPNPLLNTVEALLGAVKLVVTHGQQTLSEMMMRIPTEVHDEFDFDWHNRGEPLLTSIVTLRALKDEAAFKQLEARLKGIGIVLTLEARMVLVLNHHHMNWPAAEAAGMSVPLNHETECQLYVWLVYQRGDL